MNDNSAQPAADAEVPPLPAAPVSDTTVATGLIVFGRDAGGRPHASHFPVADPALVTKAAGLMSMRVLPLTTEALQALAAKLPAGRIFASGAGFVPFCSDRVFAQLDATPGAVTPACPADGEGSRRTPAKPKGGRSAQPGGNPGTEAEGPAGGPDSPAADHSHIGVGSVVLACEGPGEGWFEATVAAQKSEDMLVLRWRDWPELPVIVRRRDHLALLPPALAKGV